MTNTSDVRAATVAEIVEWLRNRASTCATEEAAYFHRGLAESIEREFGS